MHPIAAKATAVLAAVRCVPPRWRLCCCRRLLTASSAADLPATFDPSRDAAADIAHAISLARAEGKRVIVDVGGEWCAWCHIMDRFIAANADVRALIDRRIRLGQAQLFAPESQRGRAVAAGRAVDGYPHLFVLDAGGKMLHSQNTGELEAGKSYDKRRFLAFLERWAQAPMSERPHLIFAWRRSPAVRSSVRGAPSVERAPMRRARARSATDRRLGFLNAATIDASGVALPSATAMLRDQRS